MHTHPNDARTWIALSPEREAEARALISTPNVCGLKERNGKIFPAINERCRLGFRDDGRTGPLSFVGDIVTAYDWVELDPTAPLYTDALGYIYYLDPEWQG